jgi:hypothetical protein
MKTARDFLLERIPEDVKKEGFSLGDIQDEHVIRAMIDFAEYHLKRQAEAITENLKKKRVHINLSSEYLIFNSYNGKLQ